VSQPEEQQVLRKRDVPVLMSGGFYRMAMVAMGLGIGYMLCLDKEFAPMRPGIIDGLIGVMVGVWAGRLESKWYISKCEASLRWAHGSLLRALLRDQVPSAADAKRIALFFILFFGMFAVDTALRSYLNLRWPWVNSGELPAGATMACFLTMFLTFLYCYAQWYDSLPD
jgi:hypothetical protein